MCEEDYCVRCPFGGELNLNEKVGLMWIGERFYHTPKDFIDEARKYGISKRINAIPQDVKLGDTWIYLAHPEGYSHMVNNIEDCRCKEKPELMGNFLNHNELRPAIIYAFKPKRIEIPVRKDTPPEEIIDLHKRGITTVLCDADENGYAIEEALEIPPIIDESPETKFNADKKAYKKYRKIYDKISKEKDSKSKVISSKHKRKSTAKAKSKKQPKKNRR